MKFRREIKKGPARLVVPRIWEVGENPRKVEDIFHKGKNVSVYLTDGWVYRDKGERVKPVFLPERSIFPHMVLVDREGIPRFVLEYTAAKDGEKLKNLEIRSIQRERTRYLPYRSKDADFRWSRHLETEASKDLQRELGKHPAEFLLTEFLYHFKKDIKNGATVRITYYPVEGRIYRPLTDRFFVKEAEGIGEVTYVLSPRKRRVREILGR